MKKGAYLLTGVIPLGLASLGLCGTAFGAQSDASSMASGSVPTEAQMQQMNERIQQLEANQKQMQAEVAKARAEKKKVEKKKGSDWVMKGHGGRLKFETRDGRNSIALEGRLQEDSTMSWNGGPAFNKGGLAGNTALRRARIRVVGKIDKYWDYALQYDFTHGHIEDAYLGYSGFGFNLFGKRTHSEIIAGNQFVGFGFHVSSKYRNFLESPTPADTFRPGRELGISYRAWQKHWNFWTTFTDGYGPGGVNDVGKGGTSQYAISGRVAINFINTPNRVVQLGNSVAYEGILNKNDITYNRWRERPGSSRGFGERLIDAKLGNNIDHVLIYSPNVTFKQGPLDVVGAYYVNKVSRNNGESSPTFTGWDVQAGYFLTPGDSRPFSSKHAAFGRVHPQHPLSDGGIGAWQVAARGEQVNLNDSGVNGGKMTDAVAALNWWPENNIRFQLQYIDTLAVHGGPHAGTKPQIMAMRMQYDF